jgi:signal transduction histidine kinase
LKGIALNYFNSVRRILIGSLLLVGLLEASVTYLMVARAWKNYLFAETITQVDQIASHLAKAVPSLGYERGRSGQVLNNPLPIDLKNRQYIDQLRKNSQGELVAAQTGLLNYKPAMAEQLDGLLARLAALRSKADASMVLAKLDRDPVLGKNWVPEFSDQLDALQRILEQLVDRQAGGDFRFEFLHQMRVGLVRLRIVAGSESARFTAVIAANRLPSADELQTMATLRERSNALWALLNQQVIALDVAEMNDSRRFIDERFNGQMRTMQNSILQSWREGNHSSVTPEEYSRGSIDGLSSLEKMISAISIAATLYADDINHNAVQQFEIGAGLAGATLVLILLVLKVMTSQVIRPLENMAMGARRISSGTPEVHFHVEGASEVQEVSRQFNHLLSVLKTSMTQIQQLNISLEGKVTQRTQELSEALDHLQLAQRRIVNAEKLAALGGLVAGVAHELNTPIGNALLIASSLRIEIGETTKRMQEGQFRKSELAVFDAKTADATELMESNLRKVAELIANFKRIAVDQSGEQRSQFALDPLIENVLKNFSHLLRNRPIRPHLDLQSNATMDSFPGPIEQVVGNLFVNAVSHAFFIQAEGDITVRSRAIPGQQVEIEISDNGDGISEGIRDRIFEPFFTTRLGQSGIGLGLSIAQNIAAGLLGGDVELRSKVGRGSCFIVRIPLHAPEPGEQTRADA